MIDELELAKYLDETLKDYDIYEYRNNDYSEKQALADIQNNPFIVIESLLTIINDLMAQKGAIKMRKTLERLAKEILEDNYMMIDLNVDIDRIVAQKSDAELKEIILARWE